MAFYDSNSRFFQEGFLVFAWVKVPPDIVAGEKWDSTLRSEFFSISPNKKMRK